MCIYIYIHTYLAICQLLFKRLGDGVELIFKKIYIFRYCDLSSFLW